MATELSNTAVLDAILTAAVDAIIVSDSRGIILRANAAAAQMFECDVADLIDANVSVLMPNAIARDHDAYMSHHLETGERKIIGTGREVEGLTKQGQTFPLHLSVGNATAGDAQIFVAILHDLTHRRATEDALARSQRLDAIGQMTGGIAHDFNNLLTVIIGNLELLEMRGVDSRQSAFIRDALSSAELGGELTSRLMAFARRGTLRPILTDLRVLCADTLALLNRTLGAAYRIQTEFADDVDPVMVDPAQLQSALVNLALNARDAMGARGEIKVSIANVTIDDTYMAQETDIATGRYVRLSISDNGAGMSREAQQRAFEPFFTTKNETGGTGLGLAMVYGFVRQSGGHVTLYSELGLGTDFALYFPVVVDASEPVPVAAPSDDKDPIDPSAPQRTILVVDDNPKVRQLSVARLRDLGFETLVAETGDQAYAMLKAGSDVDLVFTDLVMPGDLNGYDLASKVMAEFPKIKILITSGYASDVVARSISDGMQFDILHKPYRQRDLAQRLQTIFDENGGP